MSTCGHLEFSWVLAVSTVDFDRVRECDALTRRFVLQAYITLTGVHPFDPNGDRSDAEIVREIAKATYDGEDTGAPAILWAF